jgi:hypothetical protein
MPEIVKIYRAAAVVRAHKGSDMRKAVPCLIGRMVLRVLIRPWCLSMMALEIARPSPVPIFDFVF